MADEREDGVERLQHEGRVFRWGRRGAAWPGHTTFVAIRGGEVVVGDRYAGEAFERTYACQPQALLEGCFQELVREQLGPRVLEELLAEVRRELGARSPDAGAVNTQPAGSQAPVAARPALAPAPSPESPPKAVSARLEAVAVPEVVDATARVDVAVVACHAVDLALAVALRGITRAPVPELLGRLRSLPCTVLSGVSRAQAEGVRERLAELGAAVELVPAHAS
jgi:ribosomal protein L7/L12